eukprot:SAG31_NODE_150_length_22290_cov_5.975801_16_plen_84_part_00
MASSSAGAARNAAGRKEIGGGPQERQQAMQSATEHANIAAYIRRVHRLPIVRFANGREETIGPHLFGKLISFSSHSQYNRRGT